MNGETVVSERWRAGDLHGNYMDRVYDVDTGEAIGEAYAKDSEHVSEMYRRAHLFAASPVMLDLLLDMQRQIVNDDNSGNLDAAWYLSRINHAIAAAKGEAR